MEINQKRVNGLLIALLKIFFNFPKKLFSPDEYNAEASKSRAPYISINDE